MGDRAVDIFSASFPSFSVHYTRGYWKGQSEDSIIIEYAGSDADRVRVLLAAEEIRAANQQQSVCVQILDCTLQSVTA